MKRETNFELDAFTRARLHLAGQIAAGLASLPAQVSGRDFEGETARVAVRIADKVIALVVSGGC